MKKTLAILALTLFIGGISVPAIAASNNALNMISLQDEDPKKKAKSEKKATKETSKEATKSSDCSDEKKSDCSGEKKSDCSSKCGGESK